MDNFLGFLKIFIPKKIFRALQPHYHLALSYLGAFVYNFPAKKLTVIGVTGTKGKSTVSELLAAMLKEAGHKVAVANTVRFAIGQESTRNLYKMTMPGRFFLQRFLSEALHKQVTHAVIEMSSEGASQYRHRFLYPDAIILTNIEPEHIASHGSYEKYLSAKIDIVRELLNNEKPNSILVVNGDDKEAGRFEAVGAKNSKRFSLKDAEPLTSGPSGTTFMLFGEKVRSALPGTFNIQNILAAAQVAHELGISEAHIRSAIEKFSGVRGRMEKIEAGQPFTVIVDYAHTPESLRHVYKVYEGINTICVLSGTGGGRDRDKRKVMGGIGSEGCREIILTDEDPYEEDPRQIMEDIAKGISNPRVETILDRRAAIRRALQKAKPGDAVLITGKGTDPFIMGKGGSKLPWDDASVAREELAKMGFGKN